VDVRHTSNALSSTLPGDLGAGETAALTLAAELNADLVLIDDRQAVAVAHQMGIPVTGTMGLLARAGRRGMIDLAAAFERLKLTNFRYRQETMDKFLSEM
jgi:predicted nucleic acid-binding protein